MKPFYFKQFAIEQDKCPMKVGTDGILLGAWADINGAKTILDIGTGTGVIAIMLAQRALNAKVHAVEIDEIAWEQATYNMQQSPWKDRLEAFQESIQTYAKFSRNSYDLIVSNPPFFSGGTFSYNESRNNIRQTIKLPHGDLWVAVRNLLNPNGKFCLILPLIEGLRFQEMAKRYHFYCTKMTEVIPKKGKNVERLLLQFEKEDQPLIKNQLIIYTAQQNKYTKDYSELTQDFYLKM